ncbi:hypothetical protein [Streptomyces melanosporofaciens]|uniref:Uncharacterized protein n=1 Tax=Streptomyces melanosporofaciens TaxID=67327 RepID=A0A1H4X2V8_STRMJ|nr:hypothetical protein [Streptomyces melanosporofaciens]SEC99907.1 hypothetical protein SAMN04490356_6428 [Streptomyces melanosporofaciens]
MAELRDQVGARPGAREIIFGGHSLALDQAEWASCTATHTATKRFLYPTTHDSTWDFAVGRYPYYGGPVVRVHFYQPGRRADQPEECTPRLHNGMIYICRAGCREAGADRASELPRRAVDSGPFRHTHVVMDRAPVGDP